MVNQRALHLVGGDAVPSHIHHIVHTTQEPEVTVLIHLGAVAGKVLPRVARPVLPDVTLGIAVDGAEHGWPRLVENQIAAGSRTNTLALLVQHFCLDTRE